MVHLPVHLEDHEPFLRKYIADRAVDGIPYPSGQDRVPVLRHQHHVVLQEETAVAVRVVGLTLLFLVHMFVFSFTSICFSGIIIP